MAFAERWFSSLQSADYVVLGTPFSDYFPWGDATIRWFNQNYTLIAHVVHVYPRPTPMVLGIVASRSIYGLNANLYVYKNMSGFRN